jgi:predicted RNA-binding protein
VRTDNTDNTDPEDLSTQSRQAAKTQLGKPQSKNLNMSKQRKQRRKYFAKNAQFSGIALQRGMAAIKNEFAAKIAKIAKNNVSPYLCVP